MYYALKNARIPNTGYNRHFKWLKEIEIQYPDEKTQNNIVSLLDKVLYVINLRKDELQKLDDLIRARFIELFGDMILNPNGWEKTLLGEVCDVRDGTHDSPKYYAEGYPLVTSKNVTGGKIDFTDCSLICEEDYKKINQRSKVDLGDILMPMIGTVGNPVIVDIDDKFAIKNVALIKFRKQSAVVNSFVKALLESDYFDGAVISKIRGGTQKFISLGDIRKLEMYLPPINVQEQFADFIHQIDKSKHHSPHLPIPPLKWYPLSKNEVPIMEEKIIAITNEMAEVLNIAQLKKLQEVLVKAFSTEEPERKPTNHEYLRLFLEAKSIEGCSPRTLQYYEVTVQHLFAAVNLPVRKMTTERMREYLSDYQQRRNCSKATIDNIRRNISSFFSWMEEEDHILKSPMRRIHKIKTKKTVKEVISDEDIEKLRDSCTTLRDLAMIDLLYSTGIRVGELVRLNIEDVNFESRECVVFGKGDKERRVYFDAKTKIHLKNYLESRRDTNRALFVSLLAPYNRLAISGVEIRLRKMGRMLNLKSIHPHKFRRTMATRAIDKGMPIEQVQKILGHSQIDTTMQYAIVNQNNVKMSHQKYIA